MGKSWSASLTVSAVTSFALLALYRFTNWFHRGAVSLDDFYQSIFVLPGGQELLFREPVQYVFFAVMALLSTWVCMELPRVFSRLAYIVGAIFLTLVLSALLAYCGILFEPFSGIAAIILAGVFGFVLGSTEEGQRQHRLHRFFVGRSSPESFQKVVHAKDLSALSGKREITVFTTRILNYPDLSSQTESHDLEQITTTFLDTATSFLIGKGAYLDACNAEGVRVFFGLMDAADTHAVDACKAALELRKQLSDLEQDVYKRWGRRPVFGIAVATGSMTVGLFGSGDFQSYSAVGEALDFSRRLCSINLVYGSHILLGARTYLLTKDGIEARPMEMVYAPRMHQISEVYELLASKGKLSDEEVKARDAFWQGVVSLRKGDYKEATLQLKKARIDGREDSPLKYFLERAEAGLKDDSPGGADTKPTARHMRMLTAN